MAAPTSRFYDRAVPFLERARGDDGQTFEGYAAVFNSPTHIRDEDGEYDEVIRPGSFKRTIQSKTPTLMFDHGKHPLIGPMPLGKITDIHEDAHGLFVRARLTDNWLIAPVRDGIRNEAIPGMSFRWGPVKQEWSGQPSSRCRYGELRTIRELRCPELGPVVSPAYADTTASVRSSFRELERIVGGEFTFRDADGLVIADSDNDPKQMVEDAVESLWGLNDFQSDCYTVDFFDDRAVFYVLGAKNSEYHGLWSVDYSYDNGQVTIGTPARVKAQGYIPVGAAPPTDLAQWDQNLNSADIAGTERADAPGASNMILDNTSAFEHTNSRPLEGTTREQPQGTSTELAPQGTSGEPADPVHDLDPSTQASRRQYMRQLQLARRGISRKETSNG